MRRKLLSLLLALCLAAAFTPLLTGGALAASYTVNGITVPVSGYEEGAVSTNCRTFAGTIYEILWGQSFTSYRGTSDDLLREVPAGSERALTAENVKKYISAAALGATLRIADDIDGNDSQGTRMHSQILVYKDENGFTVYEGNISGSYVRLKYFTWEDYAQSWSAYKYFKYIKWPGASAYGTESGTFADVSASAWYYGAVKAAAESGLVNGRADGLFIPEGTLTWAEAVKLAACLYQRYYDGAVTLENGSGAAWYSPYVSYARANGILAQTPSDYNAVITRAQFAALLCRSLPASEYAVINTVADGAVPDVNLYGTYGASIYTLYRAGILSGTDGAGYFSPTLAIRRCEVAAILWRMIEPSARLRFTLT